jgi:hypothetical protein
MAVTTLPDTVEETMRAALLFPLLIAALASATGGRAGPAAKHRHVSDAQLIRYVATGFDKRKMMFKRETIGLHRGTLVVADFPCSDVCPAYTRRIIHYDVAPADCPRVGGVVVAETYPLGIAVTKRDFCEPGVLTRKPRSR